MVQDHGGLFHIPIPAPIACQVPEAANANEHISSDPPIGDHGPSPPLQIVGGFLEGCQSARQTGPIPVTGRMAWFCPG